MIMKQIELDLETGMYETMRITNERGEYIAHGYISHYVAPRFTIGFYDLDSVVDIPYSQRNNLNLILESVENAHISYGRKSPIHSDERYKFEWKS